MKEKPENTTGYVAEIHLRDDGTNIYCDIAGKNEDLFILQGVCFEDIFANAFKKGNKEEMKEELKEHFKMIIDFAYERARERLKSEILQ